MAAVLWMAVVAATAAVGDGGIFAQTPCGLPSMSHSHRVVLDQDSTFVMLWTPSDDAIDIEIQVSHSG